MKYKLLTISVLLFSTLLLSGAGENQKKIIYQSGKGADNTKTWEFYCTEGRNSGFWTKIEVPSCWEQQGFGKNDYPY